MTNEITTAKAEFALDLQANDLIVVDYVPERITPPVIIINAGTPYLRPSTIGAEFTLNLELVCVAATASNKLATERLDALLEAVVLAMPGYSRMIQAGQPYNLQTNNTEYLAANVQVDVQITI